MFNAQFLHFACKTIKTKIIHQLIQLAVEIISKMIGVDFSKFVNFADIYRELEYLRVN